MCIVLGIAIAVFTLKVRLSNLLITHNMMGQLAKKCYSEEFIQQVFNYSWVIVIPLYEFVFYPLFSRYLAAVSIQTKFVLGITLHTVTIVALISLVVVVRHNYLKYSTSSQSNATIQCIFYEVDGALSSSLDYRWMSIPNFLYLLSLTALSIGAIVVISQAPYSMRRLMVGSAYGMITLSAAP